MTRPTATKAKAILQAEINKFDSRIDFMMDIKSGPRPESRDLTWWRKDSVDIESATTDRNVAFLRAYRAIGGAKLYAEGLLLERGRVYMDRSVLRRLERDGFVEFVDGHDPYFAITGKGEELIAE